MVARRRADDGVDVERIRLALKDAPAARVAQDVDVRVLGGTKQPVRHLLPILIERRVHGGDHDVERREALVVQIQRAVRLDVALDARQQPHAVP